MTIVGVPYFYLLHFRSFKEAFHRIDIDVDRNLFTIVFYDKILLKKEIICQLDQVSFGLNLRTSTKYTKYAVSIEFKNSKYSFYFDNTEFDSEDEYNHLVSFIQKRNASTTK